MPFRNAVPIEHQDWDKVMDFFDKKKWSPVQIADEMGNSHKVIYGNVFVDKAASGRLGGVAALQKKHKNRFTSSREHRGQIVDRRPISEPPE